MIFFKLLRQNADKCTLLYGVKVSEKLTLPLIGEDLFHWNGMVYYRPLALLVLISLMPALWDSFISRCVCVTRAA